MLRSISLAVFFITFIAACTPHKETDVYLKPITLTKPRDLWTSIRSQLRLTKHIHHQSVIEQTQWLQKHFKDLHQLTMQSAPYLYYIHHEVKKRDLPGELALLPIIESAYDPFAFSHEGAAGLWQFMPGTAMGFGLKQNWWYDGRRDIYESTKAALDYLTYLNKYFHGDWLLALAAYDCGEGTVQKAIKYNESRQHDPLFWSLILPKETKSYVPRLLAIAAIIESPKQYGIELPAIGNAPYFAKIELDFQIDLQLAAKLAGITKKEIFYLNSGYNRWATSPEGPYHIVLPINQVEQFKINLAKLPKQQRVKWQMHTVKNGENLSKIAEHYQVKLVDLIRMNQIKSHIIQNKQVLIIPHVNSNYSERKLNLALLKQNKYGPQKIEYHANAYEKISSIAKKFGVRPSAIRFWNRLNSEILKKPRKIFIWKKKQNKQTPPHYYIVKKGDHLSGIAKQKQISIAKLTALNPWLKKRPFIKPKDKIRFT